LLGHELDEPGAVAPHLFESPKMNSSPERNREHLVIIGRIEDNRFVPGWWITPSRELVKAWPQPTESTEWAVAALDHEGGVLARALAAAANVPICRTEEFANYVSALLPLPDSAATVVVLHGDSEVYRRTVPQPSRITFSERVSKSLRRGRLRVTLRIDGPAPAEGAHVVARWEARGADAAPLGIIPATDAALTLDVSLDDVPGGEDCRLVAVYHDGVRAVSISSGPVSLSRRPARPILILPYEGLQVGDRGCIPLEADIEGDAEPDSVEWLIDGNVVARGRRAVAQGIAIGPHVVSVRCGAAEARADINVISAVPLAILENPLTPPWRVLPVTVTGRLATSDESQNASRMERQPAKSRKRSSRR
jgi:hypothetical protein